MQLRSGEQSLSTHRRRRACATIRDLGLPCHICGRAIDYDAAPRTRWSFSVDEVIPRSKGGSSVDLANLAPSHYGCNARRQARPLAAVQRRRSRRW